MGPPSWRFEKKGGLVREGGREGVEWSGLFQRQKKERGIIDWTRRRRRRRGKEEEEREGGIRPLMGAGKVTVLTVALTPFPSPEIVASAPYPTPDTVAPAPCPTPDRVFPAPVRSRVSISRRFQFRERRRRIRKKGGKTKQEPGKNLTSRNPFSNTSDISLPNRIPRIRHRSCHISHGRICCAFDILDCIIRQFSHICRCIVRGLRSSRSGLIDLFRYWCGAGFGGFVERSCGTSEGEERMDD